MLSQECLRELRSSWLPNITDAGLDRLIDLLEKASPLLVHGCFTKVMPMGCLATHVAWNHPRTAHLNLDAGITWLHREGGLNPETSNVIHEWDQGGVHDYSIRDELAVHFRGERDARRAKKGPARRVRELVEV